MVSPGKKMCFLWTSGMAETGTPLRSVEEIEILHGWRSSTLDGMQMLTVKALEKYQLYIPDAPCVEYLPTFALKMTQM